MAIRTDVINTSRIGERVNQINELFSTFPTALTQLDIDSSVIKITWDDEALTAPQISDVTSGLGRNMPGYPALLKTPVTIPNDALPQNLEELGIFLSPNTKYTFRFRATKYSSGVPLDLSFVVPGDIDAATISWNDTTFNGLTLGDDDESPMSATGNDISSSEVSGIITVNSESGFFVPQVRQDTVDNQTSEVTDAYMEVTQNGQ